MGTSARPVPVITDHDTGGFWSAAQRGAIAVQFCSSCNAVLHLPLPCCPTCGSFEVAWRDVAPNGTVYSWTVIEHAVHPAFATPYTVALVALDDVPSVRLIAHFEGIPDLDFDTPVQATFDDIRDGVVVPQWRLV